VLISTANNLSPGNLGTGTTRFGFIGDGSEASSFAGPTTNKYYEGKIDELRLNNDNLTAGWIATEFNNQSSPGTFISLGTPNSLPVELTYFNAILDQNKVKVDWSTASQRDNDYFTIERSTDGTNFESIGKVNGAGTTTDHLDYDFTDVKPIEGLSYYRLRQTDFNGESEIFNAVSINFVISVEYLTIKSVGPNPFTNSFSINYLISKASEISVSLTNTSGLLMFSDVVYAQKGDNEYGFTADGTLPPGMYFLNINQNGVIMATTKLMKR